MGFCQILGGTVYRVSLDGRTFSLFGCNYGRKLSYFLFSGLITAENNMFSAVDAAEFFLTCSNIFFTACFVC